MRRIRDSNRPIGQNRVGYRKSCRLGPFPFACRISRLGGPSAEQGGILAAISSVRRAGAAGERRLYGSWQLGHRSRRPGRSIQYDLLWVVALASLMAIFLQIVRGAAGNRDRARTLRKPAAIIILPGPLAQLAGLRSRRSRHATWPRCWGVPVALNLLFHIPLPWAVVITALRRLLLLALQGLGMRMIEAMILVLSRRSASAISSRFLFCRKRSPIFLKWAGRCCRPAFATRECSCSPSESSGQQ